jgi:NAD+ synthase
VNLDTRLKELEFQLKIDPKQLTTSLEDFIRRHVNKLERDGVILGLSGGIDSAVVAALCQKAVGSEKILGLIMPDKDSKQEHMKDALNYAKELNIPTKYIDLSPHLKKLGVYQLFVLNKIPFTRKRRGILTKWAYGFYQKKTGETPFSASILGFKDKEFGSLLKKSNAYYRIKHRMRMVLLYLHAEIENKLVVGAANKTEAQIGFFVKHGCDDAADIMPILDLYKTQVKQLAKYLNVPSKIIEKAPSPDIIPGMVDEEAIGIPYERLDLILLALEKGWDNHEISEALGIEEKDIIYVNNLIQKSEHMRKIYIP